MIDPEPLFRVDPVAVHLAQGPKYLAVMASKWSIGQLFDNRGDGPDYSLSSAKGFVSLSTVELFYNSGSLEDTIINLITFLKS